MTDADLLRRILGAMRPDIPMDWHDQAWLAAKGLATLEAIEPIAATPAPLDEGVAAVTVPLDVLDSWHDLADRLSLDMLAHFDVDHTKAVTREAMLDASRRVGFLAYAAWLLGHSVVDGRWVPPTRYMRHMANGAPPPPPEDSFAATPAPLDVLTAALSRIEDICKPMSFDMSGRAVWFEGGTPAGGGSRQRIWEIAHAAIAAAYAEETK